MLFNLSSFFGSTMCLLGDTHLPSTYFGIQLHSMQLLSEKWDGTPNQVTVPQNCVSLKGNNSPTNLHLRNGIVDILPLF